jgi:hypothetical protein
VAADPVAGSVGTWDDVLTNGNVSGTNNPTISDGQYIQLGATNPASLGLVRLRNELDGVQWSTGAADGNIGIDLDASDIFTLGTFDDHPAAEIHLVGDAVYHDATTTHFLRIGGSEAIKVSAVGALAVLWGNADNFTSGFNITTTTPSSGNGVTARLIGGAAAVGSGGNGGNATVRAGDADGGGTNGAAQMETHDNSVVVKVNGSSGSEVLTLSATYTEVTDTGSTPATPTGAHRIWSTSGALKGRGSSGTITTMAAAEPHCPRCGKDAAKEWENPEQGWKVSLCMWCATADGGPLAGCVIERFGDG